MFDQQMNSNHSCRKRQYFLLVLSSWICLCALVGRSKTLQIYQWLWSDPQITIISCSLSLICCCNCSLLFVSLQRNTAWTTSAGATWFPSTASATTSSMDSSAASPAPARGRRARTPPGPWLWASEGDDTAESTWERWLTTHRTVLDSWCVFLPGVLD